MTTTTTPAATTARRDTPTRARALAGTGLCWLPDYMCQHELQQGRLVQLLPEWSQPPGIVHAVFASRRGLSPAVRGFLDFLGETARGAKGDAPQ